jgi:hypothetical protein
MDGTAYFRNNAVFNNNDDIAVYAGSATIQYNATDDLDGTNAVNISPAAYGTEAAAWTAAFRDYANGDFRLRDSASLLFDSGTTIVTVTEDIIGTARPYYNAYDIGAFEHDGLKPDYQFEGNVKLEGAIKFE